MPSRSPGADATDATAIDQRLAARHGLERKSLAVGLGKIKEWKLQLGDGFTFKQLPRSQSNRTRDLKNSGVQGDRGVFDRGSFWGRR
jgi:hypothetical protein